MQVVLQQDVPKLGYRGDIVSVKNGYFRNFLFPRGLGLAATASRLRVANQRLEKRHMKEKEVLEKASSVIEKLNGLKVTIHANATEQGTLYAGITEQEVVNAIVQECAVELPKSALKMEHFKEVGEHEVQIHLGKDQNATVIVEVVTK